MPEKCQISFNLQAEGKAKVESFRFNVNSLTDPSVEFPSFPKEKMLRALREHSHSKQYGFAQGHLKNLKFKKCDALSDEEEIHILMLVFEKIGPISLLFHNKFEYLVLEGIDAQYNYIGYKTLVNLLIQVIKPDTVPIQGLGRIKAIYHASNTQELKRKASYVPILDTTEGKITLFALSIILPTIAVIVLPISWLEEVETYLFALGLLSILVCIYPIAKRSFRHSPLALLSLIASYLIVETLIHFNILIAGLNPWGIFNNISRHNLVGILRNQPIVSSIGPQLFMGFDLLGAIVPFLDIILLGIIPFTIGAGLSGLLEKVEKKLSIRTITVKSLFAALFLISIIAIPTTYHAIGKGMEGTLYASIGVTDTAEIFSEKFFTNLEDNINELWALIYSAQFNFDIAGNSFQQFAENPLIAYLLPFIIPEVAGIPLKDLPKILDLTEVVSESLAYVPNILWSLTHLESGINLTFSILQDTIGQSLIGGYGSSLTRTYDPSMRAALNLLLQGKNNLSEIESPLLSLFSQAKDKLGYSVFAEISSVLTELEFVLPILITILDGLTPWVNSTYKLTLVIDDLFDFEFNSEYLASAVDDFDQSASILDIDVDTLPNTSIIPIRDLADFSLNLHSVTKYFLYTIQNGTQMFQQLNNTLRLFQNVTFSNASNIDDPIWQEINLGLTNTENYLNATQDSLTEMGNIVSSQSELDFQELNSFLGELQTFIDDTTAEFDVVEEYFDALAGTYDASSAFSLGIKVLNETIMQDLVSPPADYTAARGNFTQSQIYANQTYDILANVPTHLLNQSAITNWQNLVKGDIQDNTSPSIYVNSANCLSLINAIVGVGSANPTDLLTFNFILINADTMDWDIFS
ncbi:MAG: hypothetical protein ACXABU_13440 [Candidatus Hodarchaeales archaeon]|jgi:hypothetical protein